MKRSSFAEHYLRHVALGEGCNCAESVVRTMDLAARADRGPGSGYRVLSACVGFIVSRLWRPPGPTDRGKQGKNGIRD